MLFSACSLVASAVPVAAGMADTTTAASPQVNTGIQLAQAGTPAPSSDQKTPESIIVKAQKRLVKEKNSPSAVTELGSAAIAATGVSGSPGTLLRQAPSIYVYSQGLGDNAPELTVRGLRGLEIATTLDGIPTQDLLAPGSFYLANNLGGVFTLSQISGVSIYPGVAYPDKNTFGTIGGTIAYSTKRPTSDFYFDVTGTVGSFGTYKEGFEVNSGKLDGLLGSGDNAPSFLLNYNNLQTQGYVDGTPNRENEMEFAFDKPYNDGLSAFQATVLYNTASGLIENEPVPVPYLEKNGFFSNYPTDLDFAQQRNDYLTIILKNNTYVNDYLSVGLSAFYLHNDNQLEDYGSILLDQPGGVAGPLTVGNSSPFVNNPGGFGEGGLYGPPVGGGGLGIFGGGYGGYFYGSGNRYNPGQYYNNPKACPASIIATYGGAGYSPCGLNDQITGSSSDTYGIQPSFTVLPPTIFGIDNTIKVGGLFAKETEPTSYSYLGAFANTPQTAANSATVRTGGTQRTIYQGYIQDKIDLLDNTLHLTPGGTLEGTFSSFISGAVFGSKQAPFYGPNGYANGGTNLDQYGPYKANKWDREALPFFNVSYDFDKVAPALKGLSAYGSLGNSALFAPVGDFGPNTAGPPPYASIVHFYEGGVKYNVTNLALSVDYFYQKVDRDFGFFEFQSGPQNGQSVYSNFGQREFKGVEGAAIYQLTPQFQLFANFSHLLAKDLTSGSAFDTVAEDQYGTVFKGNPSTGIPDWLSTFGVDYTRKSTFKDGDAIDARITGQYTGHQFTSYDLGGTAYLNVPNYPGLAALDFNGCPGVPNTKGSCLAYTRYNQVTGATTYDPNGGISPFSIFNLDVNYTLPTPWLPVLKKLTFDANIQNLFDQRYFQYYYKQISPASCGKFTSGPFVGLTRNNYSCGGEFADGIPGQPFSVFFTVTARF
jgi:iron complex outermembrane receptor protein